VARKTDITQQELNVICEKITLEGNLPTVDRVRAELGRGSRTTINNMIKVYESEKVVFTDVKITPDMTAAFNTLIQSIANTYDKKFNNQKEKLAEIQKEKAHYLAESEKHLSFYEEIKVENDSLYAENSAMKKEMVKLEKVNDKLEQRVDSLSEMKSQYSLLTSFNTDLKKENEKLKKENQEFFKRAVGAEKELEINKKRK